MSQAASSTALLILTQVASRGLTFIGNQVVVRLSTPTLLGIAVQLELVSVTILYFARESLRVALQRQPRSESTDNTRDKRKSSEQLQGAINASYLVIALGTVLCAASFAYYIAHAPDEVIRSPNFTYAITYYILATQIELLSEIYFVVIQQKGLFRARAAAETSAAINRCLIACSVAFYTYKQGDRPSVLPFAAGQLAYGVTLNIQYYRAARDAAKKDSFILRPCHLKDSPPPSTAFSLLPKPLLSLALTLYAQSTFKLLLTQGDALLLSFLAPLHSQGAFALASNYGGLLARLLFQPIEESSRNIFGALLSPNPTASTSSNPTTTHAALTHLSLLLHTYTLLSLPLLALLPPLLPTLTPLALSQQWRTPETTALLVSYAYYIPLTALNGVIDAFVTSVATPKQLHLQSISMAAFTALYGAAAWLFLNYLRVGARGLVWANAVGMVARIVWGVGFVRGWIREHAEKEGAVEVKAGNSKSKSKSKADRRQGDDGVKVVQRYTPVSFAAAALPHPTTMAAAMAVAACLRMTLPRGDDSDGHGHQAGNGVGISVQHLSFVAMAAVVLVISVLAMEMEFLVTLLREVVPRRLVERVPGLKGFLDGYGKEGQEGGTEDVEGTTGGEGVEEEDENVTTRVG